MLPLVTHVRLPLLATLALLALAVPAQAATFNVTRTDDPTPNGCLPADCSLREAIISANAAPGSTVNLPAGSYHLTIGGAGEDAASTGDLDINVPTTIQGAGANLTTVDASTFPLMGRDRVFDVIDQTSPGPPPAGTTTLSGLTISGGFATGSAPDGGGIRVHSVNPVQVLNSTISGNSATAGFGGGIRVEATTPSSFTLTGSTVSANTGADGGGIASQGTTNITNSTVSGNSAAREAAGIDVDGGTTGLTNATVAFNSNGTGGGLLSQAVINVKNSIVSSNGPNCAGSPPSSQGNNVEDASTCGFTQPGDQQNVNPQLAALANNGGPTQTHALAKSSPAVDAGDNAACPTTDQRGQQRPFDGNNDGLAVCDSGAYELRGPPPGVTTGTTAGVSDTGAVVTGTVDPSGFLASYHFEYGATTAYGGVTPTQSAGSGFGGQPVSATISGLVQNTLYHYRLVASGGGGTSFGADATFMTGVSPPVEGVSANVAPVSGTVLIGLPLASGARARVTGFAPLVKLTHKMQIPMGSLLETKHGVVALTTATNHSGGTQSGQFSKGAFIVQQPRTNPLTTALMTGSNLNACSSLPHGGAKKPIAGARARRSRSLFANVHGRFRTRGRNSLATVRGTEFLVKDTCAGTTTTVKRGVVTVRDFTLRKTVKVKAHHKYLARAPKRRKG